MTDESVPAGCILLDGIGRSGTSLLGRLMERILAPRGYVYYYEPFHHPSPAGRFEAWRDCISALPVPSAAPTASERRSIVELESYLRSMTGDAPKLVWKEIRLALKQRWLLREFPRMRIIHTTRDIMGVLSSHYREGAPDWMPGHRRIWTQCLARWLEQGAALEELGLAPALSPEQFGRLSEAERYSMVWSLNETFCLAISDPRFHRIRYEDLCESPLETLDGIFRFIGADLTEEDRAVATAHLAESGIRFDPSGAGTGLPPGEMPEIWRGRLSPERIAEIEGIAGKVRRLAGYPTAS